MAHKLLLADDSITIQKVVELVLAEEDFEIKSVGNGEDALNAMNIFRPEIVLADIEMPKMNGYQLCEKIKQDPKTAGIPVILLAGAFEPMDDELVQTVGADDSLIKPFESQELISKINIALTMVSAGADAAMEELEIGEEAIEVVEETEGLAEAVEVTAADDDLWAMEELTEVPQEIAEEAAAEAETLELDTTFDFEDEVLIEEPAVEEPLAAASPEAQQEAVIQEFAVPSKEEMLRTFEKAFNEKVDPLLSSMDLKDALLSSLMPLMKDSIEKILWEIAPDLLEKMLKEILKDSISSLTKEVEKVIWETVPDLAATMISKEIEKIKAEL